MDPLMMYLMLTKDSKSPDASGGQAPGLDMKKLMAMSMMGGGMGGAPMGQSAAPMGGGNPVGDALSGIQNAYMQRKMIEALTGQKQSSPLDMIMGQFGGGGGKGQASGPTGMEGGQSALLGGGYY